MNDERLDALSSRAQRGTGVGGRIRVPPAHTGPSLTLGMTCVFVHRSSFIVHRCLSLYSSSLLTAGTRLGLFEIVAPLGAGGMGEVYRGRDTKLGRDVAIKVLPPAFASHADRLD